MRTTVVIGAGHAGVEFADALRALDGDREIVLLSAESDLPYHRPPLSKDYLGEQKPQPLPLRGADFYDTERIGLRLGLRVTDIDRRSRRVRCDDGSALAYDDLVLATGSRNRTLEVPGIDGPGVHYLRSISDASALRRELADARSAVVVGAGFIGLEFAAAAARRGVVVTVVEYGERPMGRAVTDATAARVLAMHRDNGIRFLFGASVNSVARINGTVVGTVVDGTTVNADLVVVGIGAEAALDATVSPDLHCSSGVIVDRFLRTEDEHIWAIGDCAQFDCVRTGAPVRRESVQNATGHARALAKTLTGTPTAYTDLPWFWSHQGACKLQMAGIATNAGETVVGPTASNGGFSTFCFEADALVAVESVNQPGVHMAARKALAANSFVSRRDLDAAEYDLRSLVARSSAQTT